MKNVVVTGGTKGIGKAIINQFHAKGYQIITCSRKRRTIANPLNLNCLQSKHFKQT